MRLMLACEVMNVDAKEHIWNMALTKYGKEGAGTEK